MMLVLDGLMSSNEVDLVTKMVRHMPSSRYVGARNFVNDTEYLWDMDFEKRLKFYSLSFDQSWKSGTFAASKKNTDLIQVGSLISIYVVERILANYYHEMFDRKTIERFIMTRIKPALWNHASFCVETLDQGTISTAGDDYLRDSHLVRCFSSDLSMVNEYYKEAAELLRDGRGCKRVYTVKGDFLASVYKKLEKQVRKCSLKFPHTLVLDVDGVILDWEGDDPVKKLDRIKDSGDIRRYTIGSEKYMNVHGFERNITGIMEFIRKNVPPSCEGINMVLLTARDKANDKLFLDLLASKLQSWIVRNERKYVHFDFDSNVLLDPVSEFVGSSFHKGLSIHYLLERILTEFPNRDSGVYFLDDRDKYIRAAYHNMNMLMHRETKRATEVRNIMIGKNPVFFVKNETMR